MGIVTGGDTGGETGGEKGGEAGLVGVGPSRFVTLKTFTAMVKAASFRPSEAAIATSRTVPPWRRRSTPSRTLSVLPTISNSEASGQST